MPALGFWFFFIQTVTYARDVFYGGVKCVGKLVDMDLILKFAIQVEAKISY